MKRALVAALAAVMLLPVGVAATDAASLAAVASAAIPDETSVRVKRIKATKRKDGVRISTWLDGPLVAGQPARIRTRVKNTRDKPIWWYAGPDGVTVSVQMTDASWRVGEPPVPLPKHGETGFPARQDLKNEIVGDIEPNVERILLLFKAKRYDTGDGDMVVVERIPPGQVVEYVHEWDGFARVAQGLAGTVGLPPSGPVRVAVSAHYRELVEGEARAALVLRGRTITAKMKTSIVNGWDDDRLHPREVVDAALEDPEFAHLMEEPDFNRYDSGYIAWDFDTERWYVGSCGRAEGDKIRYWRLGAVDPFSGEVLELVEGYGDASCGVGTWPEPVAVSPGGVATEAAPSAEPAE